jgi:DNA-binding PadR family transcriptional regulator
MAGRRKVGNLLALPLLTLLTERPMYPYEMATKLRQRGKDQAIKINWGSFYTVVQNLEKHGFIEAVGVVREGRQPERTTYQITDAGRAELMDWLRELLSVPEREHTSFEAALGESGVVPPDELIDLLQQRLAALEESNGRIQAELTRLMTQLPRLFLIESEYYLAQRRAEEQWVRELLKELTSGTFPGLEAWRHFHATGEIPDEVQALAILEGGAPPGGNLFSQLSTPVSTAGRAASIRPAGGPPGAATASAAYPRTEAGSPGRPGSGPCGPARPPAGTRA